MDKSRLRLGAAVLMLLVGMGLMLRDRDPARHPGTFGDVSIVEGWAMPNADGTAISLHPLDEPAGAGEGYVVAGATWRGLDGSSRGGGALPTCVGDDTAARTHVRLGLVHSTFPDGHTYETVVWMECLSEPVG